MTLESFHTFYFWFIAFGSNDCHLVNNNFLLLCNNNRQVRHTISYIISGLRPEIIEEIVCQTDNQLTGHTRFHVTIHPCNHLLFGQK